MLGGARAGFKPEHLATRAFFSRISQTARPYLTIPIASPSLKGRRGERGVVPLTSPMPTK